MLKEPSQLMKMPDPDTLVNRILALWEEGIKDDTAVIEKIRSEFQFSQNDAEWALELTQTGLFRAQIISKGEKYPKNNLTNNPVVRTALRIGLTKLGRPELYETTVRQDKRWWKFW
jgi:hypothetical protein